ncbi:MAG: YbhB/YbcL family Raf kinase inhibitor-like protein, partial [Acidobacteriaceae bacterium]
MVNISKLVGCTVSLVMLAFLAGCKGEEAAQPEEGAEAMTIQLTSTAFEAGEMIPRLYTCDDKNISPPLAWTGVPSETVSLVLIMDDPDAPAGTWVHWVLYNLLPEISSLDQGTTG